MPNLNLVRILLCFVLFAAGYLACAMVSTMHQETYFEPNSINNYFYENPKENRVKFSKIFSTKWQLVCSEVQISETNKLVVYGSFIQEGLLDYLERIILVGANDEIGVLNFDSRRFQVIFSKPCIDFDSSIISKTSRQLSDDPDGVGNITTVYKISDGGEGT